MNNPAKLTNQKRLSSEEENDLPYNLFTELADTFSIELYKLLTLDCARLQGTRFTPTFESRDLTFRGLPFRELKRTIRENWPYMAQGLVERVRTCVGKKIFYSGAQALDKTIDIYVNALPKPPLVIHLSDIERDMHRNHFLFYGGDKEKESLKNLVGIFSKARGYSEQRTTPQLKKSH